MKTFNEFINEAADDKDPYWNLFEINKVANQAVLNAVEYGYKKAEEQANTEITRLNKMVFDLQNAAIEMAGKLKEIEDNRINVLDKVIIFDEHGFSIDKIEKMAEDIVYEKIQDNLIDTVPFKLVLVGKVIDRSFTRAVKYEYLVIRTQHDI